MDNWREQYRQILCTLVFVILIVGTVCDYPYDQCETCECCAGECDVANNYACDFDGCIDYYWGTKCSNRCWDDYPCVSCGRGGGLWCTTCGPGFYVPTSPRNDATQHCIYECNSRCETCTGSPTNCQNCKDGYENTGNITDCSFYTCPSNCEACSSGIDCSECKPGFYDLSCDKSCLPNCLSCNDAVTCTECKPGFYSSTQNNNCSYNCPDNCYSCTDFENCTDCNEGYYGNSCEIACSHGCTAKTCDKDTGYCPSCFLGFIGSTCDACDTGTFGSYCNITCSQSCQGSTCDRNTGYCIYGCVRSKYGNECGLECPVNCMNGICSRESGVCLSCKQNFSGDGCDRCSDRLYGTTCSNTCPANCLNLNCEKDTGHCIACVNNRFGYNCEFVCPLTCLRKRGANTCGISDGTCLIGCENGLYGRTCQKTCQQTCANQTCDMETGKCSFGCYSGFSGEFCIAEDSPAPVTTTFTATFTATTYGLIGALCLTIVVIIVLLAAVCWFKRKLDRIEHRQQADDAQFSNVTSETSNRIGWSGTSDTLEIKDTGTADRSSSSYEMMDRRTTDLANIYNTINNDI